MPQLVQLYCSITSQVCKQYLPMDIDLNFHSILVIEGMYQLES